MKQHTVKMVILVVVVGVVAACGNGGGAAPAPAGGNADAVCFSELWGAHQEAQQRMWTEQTLQLQVHWLLGMKMTEYGRLRVIISTIMFGDLIPFIPPTKELS